MLKKTIACIASLFILHQVNAQYYEASQDTSLRVNHSLGTLITTPLIVFMGGGTPYNLRANLTYRRETGKGRNFRLTAVYDERGIDYTDGVLSTITYLDDSVVTYLYERDRDQSVSLRAGWEWSSPRKAIAPFYQADLILGTGFSTKQNGEVTYFRDTTATSVHPDFSRANNLFLTDDYYRMSYFAGVGLTLGWRVDMGENWMLTAQTNMECVVSPFQQYKYRVAPSADTPRNSTNVDFNWRLIDVSIFYRF